MNIKCIVVDDEPLAIEIIETYIERIPYLTLEHSFTNGIEALQYLKENRTDLMFLDIQMPDLTGIQLMKILTTPPLVVFTTAYDNYALKSYEVEAVDYLLKPIDFERFVRAAEKVWKRIENKSSCSGISIDNNEKRESFIFIKTEYRIQRVEKDEILYIEGMKNYLRIVTRTGKYMTLQSFRNIQMLLPEHTFVRVHKSYLVALDKIDSIERGRIKIGAQIIPIGETYRKEMEALLDGIINRR